MYNPTSLSTAPLLLSIILSSFDNYIAHAVVCSYKGERHNNGDRWIVRSTFVAECRVFPDASWRVDIIACQTPKGTKLHDGDEIVEDDVKLTCTKLPSGAYRMQRQYMIRNINCDGRAVGEWWISNRNFNKTCTSTGTHITNCLTDSGIHLELNSSIAFSGIKYNCVALGNGTVTLIREHSRHPGIVTHNGPVSCVVNGLRKQSGETWIEDTNFMKKCNERGAVVIEACIADGSIIDLNSNFTRSGKMYFCTMTSDGTVLFKAKPISSDATR